MQTAQIARLGRVCSKELSYHVRRHCRRVWSLWKGAAEDLRAELFYAEFSLKAPCPGGSDFGEKIPFFQLFKSMCLWEYLELCAHFFTRIQTRSENPKNEVDLLISLFSEIFFRDTLTIANSISKFPDFHLKFYWKYNENLIENYGDRLGLPVLSYR